MALRDRTDLPSKVDVDTFNQFVTDFHKGTWPEQRFGQAFMNYCVSHSIHHPELFYCRDQEKAVKIILDKYVEC